MRVARLQGPRQLSRNHTYPQIGRSCGTQNACIDVSSKRIDIEKEAVGFPEALQNATQETHVPRHDGSCHPACIVAPNARVLWLVGPKGGELSFGQLVFPHENHLRQYALEVGIVRDCGHVRDSRSALRQGRPATHGNPSQEEAVGSLAHMPWTVFWNQSHTGFVDVNENSFSLGWIHALQKILQRQNPFASQGCRRMQKTNLSGKTAAVF